MAVFIPVDYTSYSPCLSLGDYTAHGLSESRGRLIAGQVGPNCKDKDKKATVLLLSRDACSGLPRFGERLAGLYRSVTDKIFQ